MQLESDPRAFRALVELGPLEEMDGDRSTHCGRCLAECRHHHGVVEAHVLHQDLVDQDGRGRGEEVKHAVGQCDDVIAVG